MDQNRPKGGTFTLDKSPLRLSQIGVPAQYDRSSLGFSPTNLNNDEAEYNENAGLKD